MHNKQDYNCKECPLKCDLYLTSIEMGIENELEPVHAFFKKHELIVKQGSEVSHAGVMVAGNAKMYVDGFNKRSIILNVLLPSNYYGMLSVYGESLFPYNVAALGPSRVCMIDIEFVKRIYDLNQNFRTWLNKALGLTVSEIMGKLVSLNQKQVRGKVAGSLIYLSELLDTNEFTLPLTRKELAELSAITEENAVRVLTEFKREGIISVKGHCIELLQLDVLERISDFG
ncbi:MAG: Crp/Fnr family transcriptional regulator [Prolixibacteraceae bacterium]|jgi:CRP-like cAMP-binding protein|nr:Crp/Fnr family transcriptional regulator [Prolixibacteraceae bacterium]